MAGNNQGTRLQTITPFLWFNENAEEAVNFYVSIFKNRLAFIRGQAGRVASAHRCTYVGGLRQRPRTLRSPPQKHVNELLDAIELHVCTEVSAHGM